MSETQVQELKSLKEEIEAVLKSPPVHVYLDTLSLKIRPKRRTSVKMKIFIKEYEVDEKIFKKIKRYLKKEYKYFIKVRRNEIRIFREGNSDIYDDEEEIEYSIDSYIVLNYNQGKLEVWQELEIRMLGYIEEGGVLVPFK